MDHIKKTADAMDLKKSRLLDELNEMALFRGKLTSPYEDSEGKDSSDLPEIVPNKNNWIFGSLVPNNGTPFILSPEIAEEDEEYICPEWWATVIPTTIGRFTGALDKHGNKIFTGDYLKTEKSIFEIELRFPYFVIISLESGNSFTFLKKGINTMYEIVGNKVDNSLKIITKEAYRDSHDLFHPKHTEIIISPKEQKNAENKN